jgi:hypothetical protein
MNLSKNITVILLLIITVFTACSTGKKAFERGDYYEATIQAVKFLRSNPNSEKAKGVISQSYPMALQYFRQKVDETAISGSPDKYLSIVEIYTKLNNLADEISRCPAALETVKPVVYFHEQLKNAQDIAIAEQYDAGIQLIKNGNIEDARKAYEKFDWVNKTSPGYSEVTNKLQEAEEMATLRVVVEELPYLGDQYQANLIRFYDKIFVDLIKNSQQKFIKYYKPQDAEKLRIIPHQVIKMQFVDFSVGNIYEKETEKDFVSDTLVINSFKDDKGVMHDIKGVVKAKANIHERQIVSKGTLDVKIVEYQNNSILENKRFPGEYVWRNDWATFNGDERAIPENIQNMTKAKQVMPPLPQDLFVFFSDRLCANTSSFLKSYYQNK